MTRHERILATLDIAITEVSVHVDELERGSKRNRAMGWLKELRGVQSGVTFAQAELAEETEASKR